ncbi:DUF29 domain-containing protein [Methylobacter sp. Wu1]|uniref:DUF29 domain-containing protein n=1 Tax=Methylobacter sp. Wu1 TaxID=3119359 RepID=UPI002F936DB0
MISYDKDFYGWVQDQADALRAGRLSDLDIEHLIDEVEAMGRSERRALESRLVVLLVHLLKWKYQPARRGRSWQLTCKGQRINFEEILDDNPSLKSQLDALLSRAYDKAVIDAATETGLDEETFPPSCPWSWSQIRDTAFYPD